MLRFLIGIIVGVAVMMALDDSKYMPQEMRSAIADAKASIQSYFSKSLDKAVQDSQAQLPPGGQGPDAAVPGPAAKPAAGQPKAAPAKTSPLLFQR